ncbi:TauD/TfdA family dioxygenase [Actinoplanes sp. NPDC049599]|uniref:TauD/TfdA family dioxygenase n=1 Tax=Actinoplanes sp. NPDC049599 TaxID=3363903 RepID=UPI0037952B0A
MTSIVPVDRLLRGIAGGDISFDTVPAEPAVIADPQDIPAAAAAEIARRYRANGFAVARFAAGPWTEDTVRRLAQALGLGEPFVPPLYTMGAYVTTGISRIAAPTVPEATVHAGFETTDGQDLHCDGTLQDIGVVRSAILLCESQGESGGETTVFNAHGAFAELAATDPSAAQALTAPGLLVRRATMNGSNEENAGPVFTVDDEQLLCRYCVDKTDSWMIPDGELGESVRRGLSFLDNARQDGSRHVLRFTLAAGEAIIMDNTRISHGRAAYQDRAGSRRCLYRSLHLRHPAEVAVSA